MDHGLEWERVEKPWRISGRTPKSVAFAELTNISSNLDGGLSSFQLKHDETVMWMCWDLWGFWKHRTGTTRDQPPVPWHISLQTPLCPPFPQDRAWSSLPAGQTFFQYTADKYFPDQHPSAPVLLFLCSQTHSSSTWLFFPIVFRANIPTLYQLSSWRPKFVSSLLLRQLVAPVALGDPEPSSAGDDQCVWPHHTYNSWLLLILSQPHICLFHSHVTYWFLCYLLTKILNTFEFRTISLVASLQPALAALP